MLVPSSEHDRVPYYGLLLEDDRGNLYIKKSFENYAIGDFVELDLAESDAHQVKKQKTIGIIGTGLMGTQLAQFFAQAGYSVILRSRTEDGFRRAIKNIENRSSKITDPQGTKVILNRIISTVDLFELGNTELIIETIVEDMDIKKRLFSDLSSVCPSNTIIATNTSSLSITKLASFVSHPERFIGMHFFNPVSKMHLVEVVYGLDTSKQTIEYAINLSNTLGKTPIMVRDSPGFIVNRSLMPFINEAASLLQKGASPTDIDSAIKLGLNHPMGPLALADLIGLDICVSIMNTLYHGFNDAKYIPSSIFYELIKKGHLGKKTGKGFYDYNI